MTPEWRIRALHPIFVWPPLVPTHLSACGFILAARPGTEARHSLPGPVPEPLGLGSLFTR